MRTCPSALVTAFLLTLVLAACGSSKGSGGASSSRSATLTVYAAASLTESYDELGKQFEASHPGVKVTFSYAGSQTLVDQLDNGAPADVLATANTSTMAKASDKKLVGTPTTFASNVLTLITPAGNPAHVTGLDASLDGAKLVICAPAVPCGAATTQLTGLLGVTLHPVSEEDKVTDVRAKVSTGQADAGIVYRTDAMASGDAVDTIPIADADKVVNDYPIATVTASRQQDLAGQFVALVTSSAGRRVLAAHGFSTPGQ